MAGTHAEFYNMVGQTMVSIDVARENEMTDSKLRIAHRSTRGSGTFQKPRWTELSVYYDRKPGPGGQRWIAEIIGRSLADGERDKISSVACNKLEQALRYFDDSAPARSVAEQAHLWCEQHVAELENAAHAFTGTTDEEALDWLYGPGARDQRGFAARFAADFGVSDSTVRMALDKGAAIRVPLLAVVGLMDRRLLPSVLVEAQKGNDVEQA